MLNVDQQEEVAGTITLKKTEHRNMEKLLFDRTDNGSLSFEYRGRRAVLLWFN